MLIIVGGYVIQAQALIFASLSPQEQYTLCFELLQAYLDSFDTYANFKAL